MSTERRKSKLGLVRGDDVIKNVDIVVETYLRRNGKIVHIFIKTKIVIFHSHTLSAIYVKFWR